MKLVQLAFSLLFAVSSAPSAGDTVPRSAGDITFAADAEAGLLVVKSLGGVNGQALACAETKVAARAKELMLAHAPKTPRFGAAYEEATNEAFNAQTGSGKPCANATELVARVNELALRLGETLPIVPRQ